jgi:hypothetical protein
LWLPTRSNKRPLKTWLNLSANRCRCSSGRRKLDAREIGSRLDEQATKEELFSLTHPLHEASDEGLALQAALCFDRAISEAINQVTKKTMTPMMSATMNVFVSKPWLNIEKNM